MKFKRIMILDKFPLDLVSKTDFINALGKWILIGEKKKIFYSNVHTIVTAKKDKEFYEYLKKADIVYPDGWGPVLALRLSSKRKIAKHLTRVNAADFIYVLLAKMNSSRAKIYLLGDAGKTLKKAVRNIGRKYRNIKIVGSHDGYFDAKENQLILKKIKEARPNLVLIGMGTPIQEMWVKNNWNKLPNSVYWCVGGLFNYISGTKKRAPKWMRENSLEWLYRLLQEPKRLWYRYTIMNIKFIYYLFSSLARKNLH